MPSSCAISLAGKLLEDLRELGAQDDRDLLGILERAADSGERELRRLASLPLG